MEIIKIKIQLKKYIITFLFESNELFLDEAVVIVLGFKLLIIEFITSFSKRLFESYCFKFLL